MAIVVMLGSGGSEGGIGEVSDKELELSGDRVRGYKILYL
jgi:hypothetical protein